MMDGKGGFGCAAGGGDGAKMVDWGARWAAQGAAKTSQRGAWREAVSVVGLGRPGVGRRLAGGSSREGSPPGFKNPPRAKHGGRQRPKKHTNNQAERHRPQTQKTTHLLLLLAIRLIIMDAHFFESFFFKLTSGRTKKNRTPARYCTLSHNSSGATPLKLPCSSCWASGCWCVTLAHGATTNCALCGSRHGPPSATARAPRTAGKPVALTSSPFSPPHSARTAPVTQAHVAAPSGLRRAL